MWPTCAFPAWLIANTCLLLSEISQKKVFLSQHMTDYGITTFDRLGELPQVTNASKAVARGATSIGVKAADGVVLASEKKALSPLVDMSSIQKVFIVDDHIGMTYSGLAPDSRVLVQEARSVCAGYRMQFSEEMPVLQLVRELGKIYQDSTQARGMRPFGVSLIIGGIDSTGVHVYQIDPSGTFLPWKACSSGKNAQAAKSFLEKRYKDTDEIDDVVHTALLTLKDGLDGKMTPENTEVLRITARGAEVLSAQVLQDYIEQI